MSAIARWDAFLAQIQTRHHDVLAAAESEALQFISMIASGGDPLPLSHTLMGVRHRLQELETKIIDTWHASVEQAIFDEGLGVPDRDRELVKGNTLKRALDDQREELEPRLFAELARQRYERATAGSRTLHCGWCGAANPAPIAFRAVELVCSACQARTPYEPGELLRSVAAVGAHALAQQAATPEWRAMRAAEHRLHDLRPPRPLSAIVAVERAHLSYWRAYLAVRGRYEPELARDPALEVRSRMEQWYTTFAEFEPAWVAAGRPRTPIM